MDRGHIRIIAGKWRGRKIAFDARPGLRPTGDRIRETVFNWLAPYIAGASCLDLFAGSGALSFEALSRGAASVTMIDSSPKVIKQLQTVSNQLGADGAHIIYGKSPEAIPASTKTYDIVFLDPPFASNLIATCSKYLEQKNLLSTSALIYLETPSQHPPQSPPENWALIRSKKAGGVGYHLCQRQ